MRETMGFGINDPYRGELLIMTADLLHMERSRRALLPPLVDIIQKRGHMVLPQDIEVMLKRQPNRSIPLSSGLTVIWYEGDEACDTNSDGEMNSSTPLQSSSFTSEPPTQPPETSQ